MTTTVSIPLSPPTGVALNKVATRGPSGAEISISSAHTRSGATEHRGERERAQRKIAPVGAPVGDHVEEVLGGAAALAQALDDAPRLAG